MTGLNKKKYDMVNIIIGFALILWGFCVFYPFYNSVLVSFMKEAEYMRNPFSFYVKSPTLAAYKEIFSSDKIYNGYKSTLIIITIYAPLNMIITTSMAYAMSRKEFPLSRFINNIIIVTMYFGGGIVPLYLLVKNLGLVGSWWSVIIVGITSTYNMILIKNFFYTIPDSLEESAKLDGANDIVVFYKIYLPLAKPITATVLLFVVVSKWNEWYLPMLFLSNSRKWPVQLVLKEIIGTVSKTLDEQSLAEDAMVRESFALNVQMAAIVVTMLPIMLVYPFLQKYFMKGIMIGAVKS